MNEFFIICVVTATLAVVGVLATGIVAMIKGGEFNKKYGNKLMQARVLLQGIALAMLAMAFFSSQK